MALIDCQECGKQYSDMAPACPNCAAPTPGKSTGAPAQAVAPAKKNSFGKIVLTSLVCFLAVKCAWDMRSDANLPVAQKSPADIAADKAADKELNAAAAVGLAIKRASKDPSSFKMESFLVFRGGAACYEFRAKNSFGAIVPAQAVYDGKNTWLSEKNGNQFVRVWNNVCTKPGGAERARDMYAVGVWD